MNDLMGSLRGAAGRGAGGGAGGAVGAGHVEIEMAGDGGGSGGGGGGWGGGRGRGKGKDGGGDDLGGFFQEVALAKKLMNNIKRDLQRIRELHEQSKTMTNVQEIKEQREEIQGRVDAIAGQARGVKVRLEAMEVESGLSASSSEARTRESIKASLHKRLKGLMGEYADLREQLRTEYVEVVSRKMFTVTGEKPDTDAVERMIESGESEAIFQKATLTSGRGHIMSVLEDVVEQKDAILQLETKLVELQQIFMDLAVLVEAQGETLDNIETQVAKTVDFVNSGTSALVDAKTYQQRSRKTMCCVIVILLSIILVIVVGVLKPWESGQA